MILGVIAHDDRADSIFAAEIVHAADFVAGVYTINNGVSATATDVVDATAAAEIVVGEGLVFDNDFFAPAVLQGTFSTTLLSGSYTAVIEFELLADTDQPGLYVVTAADDSYYFEAMPNYADPFYIGEQAPSGSRELYGELDSGSIGAGFHRLAITRHNKRIAASLDGATTIATEDDLAMPAADAAAIGGYAGGSTYENFTVRYFEVRENVLADSQLEELSALDEALSIVVAAGSYSITGQDVFMFLGPLRVEAAAGAYSITGQEVTLTKAGPTIVVDAGSYSIAGQDVTLTPARQVAVAAGSYSISGQDVTLTLGAAPGAWSYIGSNSADISSSSHTFSAEPVGAADADRTVVVVVASESGSAGHQLSSATIGGITATIEFCQFTASQAQQASVIHANVPTGTTANIALTFNHTTDSVAIGVYRLVGFYPMGGSGVQLANITTGTAYIDTVDDGLVIGGACCPDSSLSMAYTGLTEDNEAAIAAMKYSFASAAIATGEVGFDVLMTTSAGERTQMVLSAWTPVAQDASPWVPSNIGSLRLWYKMDEISGSDGDEQASLTDASGWGNNATQASSGVKPSLETAEIDGKNVIRFNGANSEKMDLASGVFDKWRAGTIIAVLKNVDDPPSTYIGAPFFTGTAGQQNHYPYSDGSVYDGNFTDTRKSTGNPTVSLATAHILGIESADGNWTMRVNGDVHHPTSSNTYAAGTPELGRGGGPYWNGWMAEVCFFRNILSVSDRQKVEGYLAHKWGLEGGLDSGHPYKAAPP